MYGLQAVIGWTFCDGDARLGAIFRELYGNDGIKALETATLYMAEATLWQRHAVCIARLTDLAIQSDRKACSDNPILSG